MLVVTHITVALIWLLYNGNTCQSNICLKMLWFLANISLLVFFSITTFRSWVTQCHVATGSVHTFRDYMRIKASFGKSCHTRLCSGVKNKPWSLFSIPLVINWSPMSSSPEANLKKKKKREKQEEKRENKTTVSCNMVNLLSDVCKTCSTEWCLEIQYLLLMANLLAVFSHWQSGKLVWWRKGQVITNACSHIPSCHSQQSCFGLPLKCLTDFSPDLLLHFYPSQMRSSLLPNVIVLTLDLSRQEFVKWHLLMGGYWKNLNTSSSLSIKMTVLKCCAAFQNTDFLQIMQTTEYHSNDERTLQTPH